MVLAFHYSIVSHRFIIWKMAMVLVNFCIKCFLVELGFTLFLDCWPMAIRDDERRLVKKVGWCRCRLMLRRVSWRSLRWRVKRLSIDGFFNTTLWSCICSSVQTLNLFLVQLIIPNRKFRLLIEKWIVLLKCRLHCFNQGIKIQRLFFIEQSFLSIATSLFILRLG